MTRGVFISFEGGEGVGKTTQIEKLSNYFRQNGRDVLVTREPGGTPLAEKIRQLIVQRDGGDWHATSELLLFLAARNEHVEGAIKPALAAGKIVLCDRFSDSTFAYQGYGRGQDLQLIEDLHRLVLHNFLPDLTFFLDMDSRAGLQRAEGRIAENNSTEDRFEQLENDFHKRVRNGFLARAEQDKKRFHCLDASRSIDDIHHDIINILEQNVIS